MHKDFKNIDHRVGEEMTNRRELLTKMSLFSLGTYLIGCSGRSQKNNPALQSSASGAVTMNVLKVYFHGLFGHVFNANSQQIEVYVPTVDLIKHSHVYRAGRWTKPKCGSKDPHEPDLVKGETYTLSLTGYTGTGFPVADGDSSVRLKLTGTNISDFLDTSKLFCSLILPQTKLLQPVHRVFRKDGQNFFEGRSAVEQRVNPSFLARTFIFTYASNSPFQPALVDSQGVAKWQPTVAGEDLHIFAEPEDIMMEGEEDLARQAFAKLIALFKNTFIISPIKFKLSDFRSEFPPNQEPEEETSLGERHCVGTSVGGAAGGDVANCVGTFISFAP
jgi:hypothetical protein